VCQSLCIHASGAMRSDRGGAQILAVLRRSYDGVIDFAATEIHAAPAAAVIAAGIDKQPATVRALTHLLKLIRSQQVSGGEGDRREDMRKIVGLYPLPK